MTDPRLDNVAVLPYLGGYFDGEGCVTVVPSGSSVALSVGSTSLYGLRLFKSCFGGRITPPRYRPRRKPSYTWVLQLTAETKYSVLDSLIGVTVLKKRELRLARRFLRSMSKYSRWNPPPTWETKRRDWYRLSLQRLKRIQYS